MTEPQPLGDHPHNDPGDGRSECQTCGKWVWPFTHSCKGIPVTESALARFTVADAEQTLRDNANIRRDISMEDKWFELIGDNVPYHLRLDEPPLGICDRCQRKTWSESELGAEDRMPQPDGNPCGGRIVATEDRP